VAPALKIILFTEISFQVCKTEGDNLAIFSSLFLCHLGKPSYKCGEIIMNSTLVENAILKIVIF